MCIFLAQGSASVGSKHTVYMSDDAEKTPDEKPSPEQSCKVAAGKKAPLFTSETRTIIWGVQARAVQVCMEMHILAMSVSASMRVVKVIKLGPTDLCSSAIVGKISLRP